VKWLRRGTIGFAAVLLVALCFLEEGGEREFCPETLEFRGVKFVLIRFTDVVLWSSPTPPYRSRLIQFWFDEGYVQAERPAERWHPVYNWRSGTHSRLNNPTKLFGSYYADGTDPAAERWIAWSHRHPELAADLWPRVVGLLRRAGTEEHVSDSIVYADVLMGFVSKAEDAPTYREWLAVWEGWLARNRD